MSIVTEEVLLPHVIRHMIWSRETFGVTRSKAKRAVGLCAHINKEVDFADQNPADLHGYIGASILAMDYGWRIAETSPMRTAGLIARMSHPDIALHRDARVIVDAMRVYADTPFTTYHAHLVAWAIGAARNNGFNEEDFLAALDRQAETNEGRTWPLIDEDQPFEHDRSHDARERVELVSTLVNLG